MLMAIENNSKIKGKLNENPYHKGHFAYDKN